MPLIRLRHAIACLVAGLLLAGAPAAAQSPVRIELRQGTDGYTLVATNTGIAPMALDVQLQLTGGARSDRGNLLQAVVRARESATLARIRLSGHGGRQGISWRARQSLGDPRAVHDPEATYRLPFPPGQRHPVGQAPGGRIRTHTDPGSAHAVDISLPMGTPVLAARDGWVIDNVRYFGDGAPSKALLMRANYVRVLHDDGTWAVYAHLDSFSSDLAPGKRVRAGEPLGRSGNSGYSSGPHLHFVVQKNGGAQPLSLPFRFRTEARGAFTPRQDEWLGE
jgi:murein DD-endopeptidase MepM/ murein hydrolase activator NlpD